MQNAVKKIDELFFNKQYKEALEELDNLIKQFEGGIGFNKQLAFLYYYKASILNFLENFQDALFCINKACQLDPGNVKHFILRSHLHQILGNNDNAMQDQIIVLEKMPSIIQGHEEEYENAIKYMKELGINYQNGEFTKEELVEHLMNLSKNKEDDEKETEIFDYKEFANDMAEQAKALIPDDISENHSEYLIEKIRNFTYAAGEAIDKDPDVNLTVEEKVFIAQVVAEWTFHKCIDLINSEIPCEYWDSLMEKIAFVIYEITKNGTIRKLEQQVIIDLVEHHLIKTWKKETNKLKVKILWTKIKNTIRYCFSPKSFAFKYLVILVIGFTFKIFTPQISHFLALRNVDFSVVVHVSFILLFLLCIILFISSWVEKTKKS